MPSTLPCALCKDKSYLKHASHEGYQKGYFYKIYHCDFCSTAFADPLKVETSIYDHIYKRTEDLCGYDRYLHYFQEVKKQKNPLKYLAETEDVYWSIYQFLKEKKKELKILEIGCGYGYLTYALSQAGFNVTGIDISKFAIEQAKKAFGEDLFLCEDILNYSQKNKEQYDVVIFTEVIEHISNVWEFMKAAKSLVKPKGNMLVSTPNKTPYKKEVLWETEPPPVHLWWFSENSFKFIAKELNMKVKFTDFSRFNIDEMKKKGDFLRPLNHVNPNQPSREPKLDTRGEVIKIKNLILQPSEDEKPTINLKREKIKKILKKSKLLPFFKKPRDVTNILFSFLKNPRKKIEKTTFYIRLFEKRRHTLCAIFYKK